MSIIKREKLYIGGQWLTPVHPTPHKLINPSIEEVFAEIVLGGMEEVDAAVAAARAAFEGWAATPQEVRVEFLLKLSQSLLARKDELAELISREVGTPIRLSIAAQAMLPIANLEKTASVLAECLKPEQVGNSIISREAIGVVACITPWNYPLHQLVAKVAPALAVGCTVVVKPSELAPLSAFILADTIDSLGFPPGVFNLVTGTGAVVGEALVAHPGVDMVSFTGSTVAGRRVGTVAAQTVKRVALELGGKSANILLDDADLDKAIPASVWACLQNSGQTCTAHTRLLIPEEQYDEISARLKAQMSVIRLGNPLARETQLGPVISETQRSRVRRYIDDALAAGAELIVGGSASPDMLPIGYYVQPTVLGRVVSNMTIAQEEVFGPVLSVMTYRTVDEAVRIANDTIYGLSGGVWSRNQERALGVANRLRTGQVEINGGRFNVMAPFGGYRQSGNGRELGRFGLEEFTEIKSVQLP